MGQSKTTTENKMPRFQQQFLENTLLPFATNISNQGFTPYGGQMTAGVSDTSRMALPQFNRMADIANMSPEDYAAMTRANLSPFQDQVINATLARADRDREIARTGEMAAVTRAGAFGNERRGVFEGVRQAEFDIGREQLIANLLQQGYTQAQAASMAQLAQAQGAAGQAAAGFQQLGGLEQVTEQAALDAAFAEFMREQNLPYQQLGALTGAASGVPGGYGTVTETKKPGLIDYLTAGATAYSAYKRP
jgi:hypothetical protein